MLKSIIEMFRAIFANPVIHNDVEAYIAAGNPQNTGDVDRLEREFYEQRRLLSRHWLD